MMIRHLAFVLLLSLVAEVVPMPARLVRKNDHDRIPGQYIVVLKPKIEVDAFLRKLETAKASVFDNSTITDRYHHVFQGFSAKLSPHTLQTLLEREEIDFIEENGVVKAQQSVPGSWGIDRVDQRYLPLDGQAQFTGDGSGVTVYILDTGIYPTNDYFGGRAAVGFDAVGGGQQGIDCNGHGTHCAGTVGADTYGIARGASLIGVRVLNCLGSGSTNQIVAGLDWVQQNAQYPAVASMSLSGSASPSMDAATSALIASGVLVSVAASNDDTDACTRSPARVPEAVTVGATDILDTRASFSNYGTCVDIFAPGVDITSTWIGSSTATNTISGTSMACPHVTGGIAIALGNDNALSPAEAKQKIVDDGTADVVQDPGPGSPNLLLYIP